MLIHNGDTLNMLKNLKFHGRFLKNSKFCTYWKNFSEFHVLTCNELLFLTIKDANIIWFCRIWKYYSMTRENTAKKVILWFCFQMLPKICFMIKVVFFSKESTCLYVSIGGNWRKSAEIGQKRDFSALFCEIYIKINVFSSL